MTGSKTIGFLTYILTERFLNNSQIFEKSEFRELTLCINSKYSVADILCNISSKFKTLCTLPCLIHSSPKTATVEKPLVRYIGRDK